MIAGIYRLSYSDIEDLKSTISKITTCNSTYQQLKNSDIWIQCQDPDSTDFLKLEVFQAEIQKKFKIVNNLSGITLSVLEDTQRLLQQRQELKNKSEELLQGLHFLELDYYELREENQKLKEILSDSQTRLQNFIHQRDSALKKHEEICQQLTKNNQYLEKQLKNLELEKGKEISPSSEMLASIISKNYNSLEQEILNLRVQVYDLKKQCRQFEAQNQVLEIELMAAKTKIIDLQIEADAQRQIQYNGEKMVFRRPSSNSFYEKDSDSMLDRAKSNLKIDIESIPNIILTEKLIKQSNKIFNISNESSLTSSHRSRFLPEVPEMWMTQSEKSVFKDVSKNNSSHPTSQIKKQNPKEDSDQSKIQSVLRETSFAHCLESMESEDKNSNQKSMIKTQMVNTQLNKQTKQSQREQEKVEQAQPFSHTSIYQKIVEQQPVEPKQTKMLRRVKSFSKIAHPLVKSQSQNNIRLYTKYRGQLESKYPNLKQFKNKVLEKKIQIIGECVAKKTSGFQRKNYEKFKKDCQINTNTGTPPKSN